jgi:hypothetical protein
LPVRLREEAKTEPLLSVGQRLSVLWPKNGEWYDGAALELVEKRTRNSGGVSVIVDLVRQRRARAASSRASPGARWAQADKEGAEVVAAWHEHASPDDADDDAADGGADNGR